MESNNIEEKEEVLKSTIQKLDKQFGDKSVMLMDDNKTINIPVISTGSITLDRALGIGGFPRGRIIEIYGPESSGKTTLCLQCIRETQKLNGLAAFIDAEYAFDVNYAKGLGIDMNKLYYSQPNNGEEALRITEELIKTNCIPNYVKKIAYNKRDLDDIIQDIYILIYELPDDQVVRLFIQGGVNQLRKFVSGLIVRQLCSKNGKIRKKYDLSNISFDDKYIFMTDEETEDV